MAASLFIVICMLCIFHCTSCAQLSHNYKTLNGFLGKPRTTYVGELPPDMWFEQKLDYFDSDNSQTWKQKYNINGTFYKPGGPVFYMIGGEGPASAIWLVDGQWINDARLHNAFCVQLEHRFYGKSHPTKDVSVKSLKYLHSRQALADLVSFKTYFEIKYKLLGAKWITFGGSYPGSLSAWARSKYPQHFHAAVATSAPIKAVVNFVDYFKVVKNSLNTFSSSCTKAIAQATKEIGTLITSEQGRQALKQNFKLCEQIKTGNSKDVATLYQNLAGNFAGVVQYNKDNREFEGGTGANITIDTLCDIMVDTRMGSPLQRYAAVNKLMLTTSQQSCLDFSYKTMITELRKAQWSSAVGGRPWMYQTCNEFGFYQTSDYNNQPFGHHFPIAYFTQQCVDVFGPKYNAAYIRNAVKETNRYYGGYGLNVSRVVFPNGSIDPWHALGVTKNLSPDAKAIFIKGTAHCANMYPSSPEDPPQLVAARKQIQNMLGEWLKTT